MLSTRFLGCGRKPNLSPLDGRIVLHRTEQRRIVVLNHLASGELVKAKAAEPLGVSKARLQRFNKAYFKKEVVGLAHGKRDRPPRKAIGTPRASLRTERFSLAPVVSGHGAPP
jgi:hypothetical protein